MSVKVQIKGLRAHKEHMERRRNRVESAIAVAIIDWAELIENHAIWSVIEFGIPSPNHIVSSPHNPPNSDTFTLAETIHKEVRGEGLATEFVGESLMERGINTVFTVDVIAGGSRAPYAVALEWGTSNMIERPFMLPASTAQKQAGIALVHAAVRKANKNG